MDLDPKDLIDRAAEAADYDRAIAGHRDKAADQLKKRDELKAQAEAAQKTCDALNYRDGKIKSLGDAFTGTWPIAGSASLTLKTQFLLTRPSPRTGSGASVRAAPSAWLSKRSASLHA